MISTQKVGRISPLNAIVFACIFQDAEKAGKAMLDFLNAVLKYVGEEPIVEILDMKSEYAVFGEIANQKYGRLDVRVKAESGRIFDVEVQIDKDYMNERGFFYGIRIGEEESHEHRLCRWFVGAPPGHFVIPPIGGAVTYLLVLVSPLKEALILRSDRLRSVP